jgi:hypothetical protein
MKPLPAAQVLKRSHVPFQYKHDACRDHGVVMARLKDGTPGFYSFRCWCNAGKFSRRRFPLWDNFVGSGQFDLVDGV